MNLGSQKYQAIDLQTRVEDASPHELILLLLQRAKTIMAIAQGNIQRNEIEQKGKNIGKAILIVQELQGCLNFEKGSEIAINLASLYQYVQELLLKANLSHDPSLLTESTALLNQLQEAWQEMRLDIETD